MVNEKRLIDRFLDYVQIYSPTLKEADFKERLKSDLEALGLEVEEDNVGELIGSNSGNLIAKLKGNKEETLLFSCHMDTVSPGIGIEPEIRDGVIYSKGDTILAADDKAGIAALVEMLTVIKEDNIEHPNLEFAFTIAEEGGLFGSKNLDYSKLNADMGFVLDSGAKPGTIIVEGPAQSKVNVKFKGKAAHAGVAPQDGVSAIMIAADAISNMKLLRIDEETTANIGSISGGGPTNIVTEEVIIKGEARSLNNDKLKAQVEHMVQCVKDAQAKYGIEAEIEILEAYKAFKVEEDTAVVQRAKKAADALGFESPLVKSGGGSDTNNYNLNGIPAVNLGIGQQKPHSVDEHIAIEDIVNTTRFVLELIKL